MDNEDVLRSLSDKNLGVSTAEGKMLAWLASKVPFNQCIVEIGTIKGNLHVGWLREAKAATRLPFLL
ncbi:hypothetical protein [Dethiobacter alkaliphilus]|uniref:hypothetical protein n=1 Tax=Dethiobacter alkaliphilus TaxID=427926 RepID=UPI002226F0F8|nr:hypothetical protein [Dethiobacter alkaliphilus]MCW3489259.1 hypothetical protein [Dethiobacter alkaliphilus]